MPSSLSVLESVQPVYESMPGWQESTSECRTWDDLPENARSYLNRISDLTGVPIALVGVGSGRKQLVIGADERAGWVAETVLATRSS
jgi:adenylosuccinate synthase